MKKTPVAVIGFLRKDVLEVTLRNLSLAEGVLERDICVYLSAPRNEADVPQTTAVRQMVEEFKRTTLPNIIITLREKNEGASKNICAAITDTVHREEGRAIIIEDDVLVSRTFLRYMDAALDYYENDKRIWCINGYQNPHLKIPKDYPYDVYLNPINMAWGWGVWRDRWEAVDFDVSDWLEVKKNPELLARIERAGSHIPSLMDCCVAGDRGSWDAQCSYFVAKNGLYCVEPRYSETKNNGMCTAGAVHKGYPNGTISKQKYYNFVPRFQSFDEMMQLETSWLRNFQFSVRDRRRWPFLLRCARRLFNSYVGGVHNEPITV